MTQSILFLTPQLPYPAHQGTALRNFGLIKGLAKRGYQVSLASFEGLGQGSPDAVLAHFCERITTAQQPPRSKFKRIIDLANGHPDMARRLWSHGFEARIELLVELHKFDVVHIEGIEMAPYIPAIKRLSDAKIIYDAHNAEFALQQRIAEQAADPVRKRYSHIQVTRLTRWEAEVCETSDHILAVSERDAQHLRSLGASTPITVLPNAIDTSTYSPKTRPADIRRPSVVFTGKMDFRPNVDAVLWFVNDILPLVHEKQPNVEFVVVGKQPHARLRTIANRRHMTLTGFVNQIEPYIAAADVYIAPLRMGSGTRFKLLQAMAMKRPIVSTAVGAEGLDVTHEQHLLLADHPQAFAVSILKILENRNLSKILTENAHELVITRYDWGAVLPILETVYEEL